MFIHILIHVKEALCNCSHYKRRVSLYYLFLLQISPDLMFRYLLYIFLCWELQGYIGIGRRSRYLLPTTIGFSSFKPRYFIKKWIDLLDNNNY